MSKDILLSIILILLISLTIRSIISLNDSKKRINRVEIEIEDNKLLNNSLNNKIKEVQTPEYIDKLAVEQLNMTKDGYKIVIENAEDPKEKEETKEVEEIKDPNWVLWKNKLNL